MIPLDSVLKLAKEDINVWKECASAESEYHEYFNTEAMKKMKKPLLKR